MQQLVGMHLAQAVQELRESRAHPGLVEHALAALDVLLQRAAALVAHHQVHRLVGAEEIQHAHHVGMRQTSQRAALFEETLHAVAKAREIGGRDLRRRARFAAQRQRRGQVFLDHDRRVFFVVREIDDRKAARSERANDAVVLEARAFRQCLVGLRRHLLL